MSEQLARPSRLLSREIPRRDFLKILEGIGLAALAGNFIVAAAPRIKQAAYDVLSVGDDYSNWPFLEEVGAQTIDRGRLNELLASDGEEKQVSLFRVTGEAQANQEALAEYDFTLEHDGPVFAEFGGLYGDGVSLAILRAVVDNGEEFLVPVLRTNVAQQPLAIQLGDHQQGPHKLTLFEEHATVPVAPEEITPRLSQGYTGDLRNFLEENQPDIYLFNYDDIADNFPWHSYVVVNEAKDGSIAAVYIIACFDEDPKYGFETSVEKRERTKGRPGDSDWCSEEQIDKRTGRVLKANIATPYHRRQAVPATMLKSSSRLSVRIASPNNNVELATDPSLLKMPKVRFRPTIVTHDEMYWLSRTSGLSAARHTLCENLKEGGLRLYDPNDAEILRKYQLDPKDCH